MFYILYSVFYILYLRFLANERVCGNNALVIRNVVPLAPQYAFLHVYALIRFQPVIHFGLNHRNGCGNVLDLLLAEQNIYFFDSREQLNAVTFGVQYSRNTQWSF